MAFFKKCGLPSEPAQHGNESKIGKAVLPICAAEAIERGGRERCTGICGELHGGIFS